MDRTTLQYLIEDILEVKCGETPAASRKMAESVIKRVKRAQAVRPIDSFSVGETLFVMPKPGMPQIRRLEILQSNGTFRLLPQNQEIRA